MEPIRLSTQEFLVYTLIFNVAAGVVLGLIPLIVGFAKKKVKLGVFGLLASAIGGAILGLILSIPAAAIFTYLIAKKPAAAPAASSSDPI